LKYNINEVFHISSFSVESRLLGVGRRELRADLWWAWEGVWGEVKLLGKSE
jgi:hypothetical protein